MDLEDMFYRPRLLRVLPNIFGTLSRLVCDMLDIIVLALMKLLLVGDDITPDELNAKRRKDLVGRLLDRLYNTDGKYTKIEKEAKEVVHRVSLDLSFSLLMCSFAIVAVAVALIVWNT